MIEHIPTPAPAAPSLLNLAQAAKLLGSNHGDRPIHSATLTRWIVSGVKARDGSRLRLKALKLPGGWRVRPEDLEAFFIALTADRLADAGHDEGEPAPVKPPTNGSTKAASLATLKAARLI